MMRITGTQKMTSAMTSVMNENAAFCHGPNRALISAEGKVKKTPAPVCVNRGRCYVKYQTSITSWSIFSSFALKHPMRSDTPPVIR